MIGNEDQEQLLKLISRKIKKNVSCYAFGGNAMMFYGYKSATKDIDLVFENLRDKTVFIDAIKSLGYERKSLLNIYNEDRIKNPHKPEIYSRGDERFDLFVKKIFQTELSENMKKNIFGRHEFIEKNRILTVNILSKETLVLLKAITERENDFNDILTICEKDKIDWNFVIDEAISQSKKGDKWILLALEETMQKLKERIFIKQELFKRIYRSY